MLQSYMKHPTFYNLPGATVFNIQLEKSSAKEIAAVQTGICHPITKELRKPCIYPKCLRQAAV